MTVTAETFIEGLPPATVFEHALNIERWPDMVEAIDRVEVLSPAPVRVGTRFRETRTMFGRSATEEMTFAEIDTPHRFVLTAESSGMAYRTVHTFAPEAGGTRIAISFGGEPTTLAGRLVSPLMKVLMSGTLRKMLESDLASMKKVLETGA